MAMENKRIIQLSTERTTLGDDDYTIVDSDTNGTAKYRLSRLKETDTTLSVSGMAADAAATGQAINAETQARTQAVEAETQARQQAISAESQARAAADTTLGNDVQDLKSAIENGNNGYVPVANGTAGASGVTTGNTNRIRTDYIHFVSGDIIRIENGSLEHACVMWSGTVSSDTNTRNDSSFKATAEEITPDYNGYIVVIYRKHDNSDILPSVFDGDIKIWPHFFRAVTDDIEILDKKTECSSVPILRDGSLGNPSNANAVTSKYVLPIQSGYDFIVVRFLGDLSLSDSYAIGYGIFKNVPDGTTSTEAWQSYPKDFYNTDADKRSADPWLIIPIRDISGYDHISVFMWRFYNGSTVPLRAINDQYSISVSFYKAFSADDTVVQHKLYTARHTVNSADIPLTILHFSDIHADQKALERIISDSKHFAASVDDMICTGDMVSNTAAEIVSWWNPDVMTCIGNHDTASYTSETGYDWTSLSMADRDAYYIAPFEDNWGIVHTTGKSYYYKDYNPQKVRLVVMDVMTYGDSNTEAQEQTTWLENLLSSAIENNLHVLIAIHAPHGGAAAKVCSFSRYGQTPMPINSDCDTPQLIIDTVEEKKTEGLKFIGYLVGHTHQDNIWDAENNGSQYMYCVACANTASVAQWRTTDLYRSGGLDAYNLVTIDTARTLVKIVRGGGADIDDHMRTRKAICFDYSTGQIVGEVL